MDSLRPSEDQRSPTSWEQALCTAKDRGLFAPECQPKTTENGVE